MYYQRSIVKGQETIKGAFLSVNKNKLPNVPDTIDDRVYYATNENMRHNEYYTNDNSLTIRKISLWIFAIFVVFVLVDFYNMYSREKFEKQIERQKCLDKYQANKCDEITINDGPFINEVCTNAQKCIKANTVFFHVIFIKYIKDILTTSFSNVGIIYILLCVITMFFVLKHLIN